MEDGWTRDDPRGRSSESLQTHQTVQRWRSVLKSVRPSWLLAAVAMLKYRKKQWSSHSGSHSVFGYGYGYWLKYRKKLWSSHSCSQSRHFGYGLTVSFTSTDPYHGAAILFTFHTNQCDKIVASAVTAIYSLTNSWHSAVASISQVCTIQMLTAMRVSTVISYSKRIKG